MPLALRIHGIACGGAATVCLRRQQDEAFEDIARRSWRRHAACCGEHDDRPGRTRTGSAELPVSVDEHRITAALVDSVYACNKSGGLICLVADADGVGLARNTLVANIDVVTARSEILTRPEAQCNVVAAGCVAKERITTGGRVAAAGVANERADTGGRVVVAGVLKERKGTVGSVVVAGCVVNERLKTGGRVVDAGCVEEECQNTGSRVVAAGGVRSERITTDGRVCGAGCEAEKRTSTLSGVVVGIGPVRCWTGQQG